MKVLFVAPVGDFNVVDGGYSTASSGILQVLSKMSTEKDYLESVDLCSTLNIDKLKVPNKRYDVVIMVTHPNSFQNPVISKYLNTLMSLGDKRYLSVVWETTPLPQEWDWMWNHDMFTGFLAPSKFVGEQLYRKTKKPIFYYPHYIDSSIFSHVDIEKKLKEKLFSVLFVGQYTKRKGLEEAVISFVQALGDKDDAELILKYHRMSDCEIPIDTFINSIVRTNAAPWKAGVYTLNDKLKDNEMSELYKSSSLLLFPTRGEGFGLPIAEAMSCGIPIIYTNCSSCYEVGEAPGNIAVNSYMDSAIGMAQYGYNKNSMYAIPNMSELIKAIKSKYSLWKINKRRYYEEVNGNRKIIEDKFGYKSISMYLEDILNYNLDKTLTF